MATSSTPLHTIAQISKVVTRVIDRLTGDRVDYPLLVAGACSAALGNYGIESHILYGRAAWVEILEDHSVLWAGCWENSQHFWVESEFHEIIDLNSSVA